MIKILISSLLVGLAISVSANLVPEPKPVLKVVTIKSSPFLFVIDDHYEGFIVDLMDLIALKTGLEYQFYLSPDGRYGYKGTDGTLNGMIGEVNAGKADLAAADLTVTEGRKEFVDFSEPIMTNQLAALVRKEDAIGMNSLEDLVRESNSTEDGQQPKSNQITIGSLRSGSTSHLLSKSEDPLGKKLFESINKNDGESMMKSVKDGYERVAQNGSYAFIGESSSAEYETSQNCDLRVLFGENSLHTRDYALALPKGSPHLEKINTAIKELKENGEIDKLREKYWKNKCDEQPTNMMMTTMAPQA